MRSAKICIIGDFAVGKTSTVARFVKNEFSEKYLTTVGVKIDTKEVDTPAGRVKLIIWDVAGTDCLSDIEFAYLRGSAGFILVADGTRASTLESAIRLKADIFAEYGELPFVAILNKSDLSEAWEVGHDDLATSRGAGVDWIATSAKTGEGVALAIETLATSITSTSAGST
ncbi:MAG: GTP-binding protein [Gammaproteobacteria bacterium]|nr:GTP-binding protein [Gammaproteobacteria bacterium]